MAPMSSNNVTGYAGAETAVVGSGAHRHQKRLQGESFTVRTEDYPASLRVPRASFVTLHVDTMLHGCIGTLGRVARWSRTWCITRARRHPRIRAFQRLRFPSSSACTFTSRCWACRSRCSSNPRKGLLRQLRPHVDGLILEEGPHRGTFLPSVWDELPAPHDFLCHLKRKAGLPADYWSRDLRVRRYTGRVHSLNPLKPVLFGFAPRD